MSQELISIGRLIRPQGLKGELKAEISLPGNFNFYELIQQKVILKASADEPGSECLREMLVEDIKPLNRSFLVKFSGIESLEEANDFKNQEVFLAKTFFKQLPDNEFFIDDLVGLKLYEFTHSELEVGEVQELIFNPANHLLKVKLKDSQKTFLLPFIDEYIKGVDLSQRKILVSEWQIFAE
ncbi:MAG: ribosome maturation factor RimM [Candidatus Caenarcaniphilales bacterium]|nr:ribosome maturation factor RimM [Candidatus Caenarcaniphilales bacterium]